MADVKKLGSPQVARPVVSPPASKPAAPPPAPKAQAPKGWGPQGAGASAVQAKATGSGFDTGATKASPAKAKALAQAKSELTSARDATPLPLTTDVDRRVLVQEATQYNPLARVAGNADVICSGAATVNALILTSKDDATRKANADALQASATKLGAWDHLPAGVDRKDVETALDNMRAGAMRPVDVWNLQQLAWAEALTIEPTSIKGGAKPGVLGAVVSQLTQDGAQFDGARFTETAKSTPSGPVGHWTVVVGDTYANSGEREGIARKALGTDSVDAPGWDADVRAPKGKGMVKVQIAEGSKVTAFQFMPMMVSTNGPGGLERMKLNANGQVHFGEGQGTVAREK